MRRSRSVITSLLLCVILGAVSILSACGGSESSGGNADGEAGKEELIKLRIAYNKNGGQTPQYVAVTKGFFEKHGLSVESIEFKTNTDSVAALESGNLDILASIPSTIWSAREAGFDLVAFMQNETAGFEEPDSGTLIAAPDSGINSLKDLAGKEIACLSLSSQACLDAIYLLEKEGLPRDSYKITEAPFATHYDLLANKQVDAVVTVDPFSTKIITEKVGTVLSYIYIDTNPGQPLGAWWSHRDWVEENPEIVEKFSLAIKDAIDYLHEDENRAREIVAEYTGLDPETVKNMPMMNWNYELKVDAWQKQGEILKQVGGLKEVPDPDAYFAEAIFKYEAK